MMPNQNFTTTKGHNLSEAGWLDNHFLAARAEYGAMIQTVPIQSGWRVLDAGSGNGVFLPYISEMVGPKGSIIALDLASENIDIIEKRIAQGEFTCPIKTDVGSVTSLPYSDNTFDMIWCAAVTQYLSDNELSQMLSEFKRVTKSGGRIAIKDFDITSHQWYPADPTFIWRIYAPLKNENKQVYGLLRTINLRRYLLDCGFTDVSLSTRIVERSLPLTTVEKQHFKDSIQFTARLGATHMKLEEDLSLCRDLLDDEKLQQFMEQPDFIYREGHFLVQGQVVKDRESV